MIPWLQLHLNGSVYLTLAVMATALAGLVWVLRGQGVVKSALAVRLILVLACALWIGLGLRNEWDVAEPWAMGLTLGVLVVLGLIFCFVPIVWRGLTRRRARRQAQQCVGQSGQVERTIVSDSVGRVTVQVRGRTICVCARSQTNHVTLAAFSEVRVVGVNEAGEVLVQAAE